ncbi:MAG TPA: hypothetical protein VEI03_03115 [Stellaceae bacterium]|nr:hypothetical protein [Stellaceae bacterium]
MQDKRTTLRDLAAGVFVTLALALPFLHLPGDGAARMKVHFRSDDGGRARVLSTETSRSLCTVMAAALSYDDPATGAFTRVNCTDEAAAGADRL